MAEECVDAHIFL